MVAFVFTLFVSAGDVPAAHGAWCVGRVPQRDTGAPCLVADSSSHREDRAASRRAQTPPALPAARFAFAPRLPASTLYAPPALAPRAQAATPSSQRGPPDSLA
jgi:hypothetical protein